jgi:phage terminase small subunit
MPKASLVPQDLPDWAKKIYRESKKELKEQETWTEVNAPLLESYVRSLVVARGAREERGGHLTTEGSMGQIVEHPLIKVERQAYLDAKQYAVELLLSPAARKRAEVATRRSGASESMLDSILSAN